MRRTRTILALASVLVMSAIGAGTASAQPLPQPVQWSYGVAHDTFGPASWGGGTCTVKAGPLYDGNGPWDSVAGATVTCTTRQATLELYAQEQYAYSSGGPWYNIGQAGFVETTNAYGFSGVVNGQGTCSTYPVYWRTAAYLWVPGWSAFRVNYTHVPNAVPTGLGCVPGSPAAN